VSHRVEIGDPQVRNRGTLGGSLAHADPAADYPAAMLAVDAEIHIKGPQGWRKVKASDFFQGLFTVDLAPNEIIAGVQFAPVQAARTPSFTSAPRTSLSSAWQPPWT
jgi:carbon-monoxide dehydrogenase medium subunit